MLFTKEKLVEADVPVLLEFCQQNPSIIRLCLKDNSFNEKSLVNLERLLLLMQEISISNNMVGPESARVLASVLRTSKHLHTLRLKDCDMPAQCHLLLLTALAQNYDHFNSRLKVFE